MEAVLDYYFQAGLDYQFQSRFPNISGDLKYNIGETRQSWDLNQSLRERFQERRCPIISRSSFPPTAHFSFFSFWEIFLSTQHIGGFGFWASEDLWSKYLVPSAPNNIMWSKKKGKCDHNTKNTQRWTQEQGHSFLISPCPFVESVSSAAKKSWCQHHFFWSPAWSSHPYKIWSSQTRIPSLHPTK